MEFCILWYTVITFKVSYQTVHLLLLLNFRNTSCSVNLWKCGIWVGKCDPTRMTLENWSDVSVRFIVRAQNTMLARVGSEPHKSSWQPPNVDRSEGLFIHWRFNIPFPTRCSCYFACHGTSSFLSLSCVLFCTAKISKTMREIQMSGAYRGDCREVQCSPLPWQLKYELWRWI